MSASAHETQFAPIRVRNLRDHVHDSLREAIISGRLKAGERLNERQVASELGISTSPLKEALRQLEGEGLVRTEARRGTFVTFSARQAEEMTLARAALESIMARQTAKHGTKADFELLQGIIDKMRPASASGDLNGLIALNEQFHEAIHEASGCDYLRRLQSTQHMYAHAARVIVLSREEVRQAHFNEHEAIMLAISARDEDRAERLMRDHIVQAGKVHIELVF